MAMNKFKKYALITIATVSGLYSLGSQPGQDFVQSGADFFKSGFKSFHDALNQGVEDLLTQNELEKQLYHAQTEPITVEYSTLEKQLA